MSIRSRILPLAGSLFIATAFAVTAMADTIHLKDGSIIKGQIVSFNSGVFTVEMGEGSRRRQMTFSSSEVESIRFEKPVSNPQIASTNRTAVYTEPAPKTEELPGTDHSTTIISTQPAKTDPPRVVTSTQPARTDPPKIVTAPRPNPKPRETGGNVKPIEWKVNVTADNTANGWTNTGWVVKKGQRIRISGDGEVSLGKGRTSTPSGLAGVDDKNKLLKNVPTGALIAVIGDDNNDFIYVGAEREITATRDGALFLGVNEGELQDNTGTYDVKIEVMPDGTE